MNQRDGVPSGPRKVLDRLFGAAADAPAPRERDRTQGPRPLRWAALLVGLEAAALAVGALMVAFLTVTGEAASTSRAVAEVVLLVGGAALLGAAAAGLWRVAGWARGPVIAVQLLLAALAYTAAFEADRPEIGLPVLLLVAAVLYLLATPEARVAYEDR